MAGVDPFSVAIQALTGIGGALLGSSASKEAAQVQANAAKYAADLEAKAAQDAIAYTKETDARNQANQAPWLSAGRGAVTSLARLLGVTMDPGGAAPPPSTTTTGGPGPFVFHPFYDTNLPPITGGPDDRPLPGGQAARGDFSGNAQNQPGYAINPATGLIGGPGTRGGTQLSPTAMLSDGTLAKNADGSFSVKDPNGGTHTFPSFVQAYTFAKQIGNGN